MSVQEGLDKVLNRIEESLKMSVLMWEHASGCEIVLYDGNSTYWPWYDGTKPSTGYRFLSLDEVCKVTGGRFVYIGELE